MMWYVLICLCLSLAGVAGLQFFYLAYLERIDRDRKRRMTELERHIRYLKRQVRAGEMKILEKDKLLRDQIEDAVPEEDEIWADVIDEN